MKRLLPVSLIFAALAIPALAQTPTIVGVSNDASYTVSFSPGSLAAIFGTDLAPTSGKPTVTLGGLACYVTFSSANQINVELPVGASLGASNLVVSYGSSTSAPFSITLNSASPALLTQSGSGSGPGLITLGASVVSATNEAKISSVVVGYGDGLGTTNPVVATGVAAPTSMPFALTVTTPVVTVGGTFAPVAFSGLSPAQIALYQVNFTIPPGVAPGTRNVRWSIDGYTSPPVTILIGGTPAVTTLGSSLNPSTYGQSVTLTATVAPSTATGVVTFYDGATVLGVAAVSSGQAKLNTISLPSGSLSITAFYSGDKNNAASVSLPFTQNVTPLAGGSFAAPVTYGAGSAPYAVAVGDFTGTGKADLVVADTGTTVNVLLGKGDGTFNTAVPYTTGSGPQSVIVGDLNGDGFLDVVTANYYGGNVSVLLGKGDGTFNPAVNYSAGTNPWTVAAGDFNQDGNLDLATADGTGSVEVLLGNGDGTFQPAAAWPAGTALLAVAVGDFNGDGIPDLAATDNSSGKVDVLLGNGDGTFQAALITTVGQSPENLVVSDFNGDGKADLAVALGPYNVIVLLGNGDGTFQTGVAYGSFTGSQGLVAGDFNADGIPDLVATGSGAGDVYLMLGNGDGSFQPSAPYSAGTGSLGVAVADFNSDGIADLVTANNGSTNVSILIGVAPSKSQTISFGTLSNVTFGVAPFSISATATSGLTVEFFTESTGICSVSGTTVTIVGGGTCSITASQPGNATYGAAPLVTRQFTVNPIGQFITWGALSNQALGATPPPLSATASSGLGVTFVSDSMTVCTLSGVNITLLKLGTCMITASQNGDATYTAAAPVMHSFLVLLPQTITFDAIPNDIFGISPFTVAAQSSVLLPVAFASTTTSVCTLADDLVILKGTGTCSITATQPGNTTYAAANPVIQSFTVSQAKPSGSFMPSLGSPFASGSGTSSVAVGDFNGDGVPDIAAANSGANNVTVLLGTGTGGGFTIASGGPFAVGTAPASVAIGDFNGDGKQDLAIANGGDFTVTVLLGDGMGGFTAAMNSPFTVGSAPVSVVVGDFNGDGIQDLATANFGTNDVTVLLGDGSGGFTAAPGSPAPVGTVPAFLAIGDFNGDGIEDLAVANSVDGTVTVLLGVGTGAFTAAPSSPFTVGTTPLSLAVGDFNHDGKQDLAVANSGDSNVTVLLGNGSGGFSAATGSPFAVGTNPSYVAAGDFSGNGIQDLVTANAGSNDITILLGNGSGGFTQKAANPFPVGTYAESVAVADVNADGIEDVIVANSGDADVSVLLGAVVGSTLQTITFAPLSTVTYGVLPFSIGATSSSGLPVFFASATSAVCTVSGTTVTVVGGGTCTIYASQSGNATYAPAVPVMRSFTVNQIGQTITFGFLTDQTLSETPAVLTPTASSGLPVTTSSNNDAVCTLYQGQITLLAEGVCSITATQPGDATYTAAAPITQDFTVSADGIQPVAGFLDQMGAPALTFNGSMTFPDAGGFLIGAPGVAQDLYGNAYIVGLDAAGGVHLNSYSFANSTWNGWQYSGGILDNGSIEGHVATGLSVAVDPSGVVWFTGRDIGNRHWINSWNGTSFGGWIRVTTPQPAGPPLDGIFSGDSIPQIAITYDGNVWIIGKDIGGRIWSNSYNPVSQVFSGWVDRQAVMIGQPSVTAGQDGMVYVGVRNVPTNSPVYITQIPAQNAATPNTWLNGGGLVDTDPQITSQAGTVYMMAEAANNTVYLLTFSEATQTYGTWSFTNGILNDATTAAAAGNVFIAGRDSSDRIYWYSLTGNSWVFAGGAGISSTVLAGAK